MFHKSVFDIYITYSLSITYSNDAFISSPKVQQIYSI